MTTSKSDNQEKILAFIRKEIRVKGYPPSVREICDAVGLKSTSTVHGHLQRLQKKGLLRRDPTKPRALEVLCDPDRSTKEVVNIPLVGKVAAGLPILALEHIEDTFPLPMDFVGDGDHFMLQLQGDSMIEIGMLDGDYVVVRKQEVAENGEIVVAMIDEEATVKRFYKEKGHFRLQPENQTMEPIITKELDILGKVVFLLRHMI